MNHKDNFYDTYEVSLFTFIKYKSVWELFFKNSPSKVYTDRILFFFFFENQHLIALYVADVH